MVLADEDVLERIHTVEGYSCARHFAWWGWRTIWKSSSSVALTMGTSPMITSPVDPSIVTTSPFFSTCPPQNSG